MTKSEEAQNRLENLWHYIDGYWQAASLSVAAKEVVDQMFDLVLQSLENLHGGFTREDILKAAKTELPYPYVDLEDLGFTVEEIKEYGRAN